MASMIAKFRRPRNAGELAKAVFLMLEDALGMCGSASRDVFGGTTTVDGDGFGARVIVEDPDRDDGCEWVELGRPQREHLEAWEAAGRPTLEHIEQLSGIGRLSQVEAAAVRAMRVGKACEGEDFTPEEIAAFRRKAFLNALDRGVDANLGEPEPPAEPTPKRLRKPKAE